MDNVESFAEQLRNLINKAYGEGVPQAEIVYGLANAEDPELINAAREVPPLSEKIENVLAQGFENPDFQNALALQAALSEVENLDEEYGEDGDDFLEDDED